MHTSACACSSNGDVKECNCAGDSTHGGRHVFTDAIRFFSMTAQRYVEGVVWGIFSFVLLKMIFVANAVRNISSDGNPAGELKSRLRLAARLVPSSLHASGTCNSTVVVNHSSTPSSLERGSHDRSVARSGHGGRRAVPSKFRSVHKRLMLMHFLATLAMVAGVAQYVIPVSGSTCVVAHRVMTAAMVLFDGTVVIFLLAKTDVTNNVLVGPAGPPCWERALKWFSLIWSWMFLPVLAVVCAIALPGGVHAEEEGCHGGIERFGEHGRAAIVFAAAFMVEKIVLIIEFLLLLALFINPLYTGRGGDALTSMRTSSYRLTIYKNIACTVGVVVVQVFETAVVYAVVFHVGRIEEVERAADVAAMSQLLLTLCLIEITIPLGFVSSFRPCLAAARKGCRPRPPG